MLAKDSLCLFNIFNAVFSLFGVEEFLEKLSEGEEAVLAINGFGPKSLIDAKKKLRALGYELP